MSRDLELALRIRADLGDGHRALGRLDSALDATSSAATRAAAASSTLSAALDRQFATSGKSAEDSARAFERLGRIQENFRALENSLNPALAAQRRYQAIVRQTREAVAAGAATQAQANAVLAQARTRLDQAALAQRQMTGAVRTSSLVARGHGQAIQNVGHQAQDMAVQIASGTAASRAFAQQLPQLASGFGLWGVGVGTFLAIAIPLGSHLLGLGEAADDAADAFGDLGDAADRLRGLRDLSGDLDAIKERYGRVTAAVWRLIEAQREQARLEADAALRHRIADLNEQYPRLANAAVAARRLAALPPDATSGPFRAADVYSATIEQDLARVTERLGLAKAAALDLAVALEALRTAADFDGRAEALAAMAAALSDGNDEAIALRGSLLNDESAARQLADIIESVATYTSEAADDADRLADAAGRARDELAGLATSGIEALAEAEVRLANLGDPVATATALAELRVRQLQSAAAPPGADPAQRFPDLGQSEIVDRARQQALLEQQIKQLKEIERAEKEEERLAAQRAKRAALAAERAVREADRLAERLEAGRGRAEAAAEAARLAVVHRDDPAALARARATAAAARQAQEALAAYAALPGTGPAALRAREQALEAQVEAIGAAAAAEARWREEARRPVSRAPVEAARHALAEYAREARDTAGKVEAAVMDGLQSMENALVQFVTTGKVEFRDLANSIIADLARVAIRRAITGPLADGLAGALGNVFGSPGATPGFTQGFGTAPQVPSGITLTLHSGGVAEGPGHPDLAPGEVPAVLMRGEAVLTSAHARALLGRGSRSDATTARDILARSARYHDGGVVGGAATRASAPASGAGGLPSVSVTVVNRSSQPVSARESGAGPRFDGRAWVTEIVLDDLRRGGPIRSTLRGGGS